MVSPIIIYVPRSKVLSDYPILCTSFKEDPTRQTKNALKSKGFIIMLIVATKPLLLFCNSVLLLLRLMGTCFNVTVFILVRFFSEGPSTKVGAKWSRLSSLRMATSSLHQSSVLCVELAYSFHNTGSSSCERSKSVYYFTQCSSQATFWYKPSFSSSSSPASTLHWKEPRAYRPTTTTSLCCCFFL